MLSITSERNKTLASSLQRPSNQPHADWIDMGQKKVLILRVPFHPWNFLFLILYL